MSWLKQQTWLAVAVLLASIVIPAESTGQYWEPGKRAIVYPARLGCDSILATLDDALTARSQRAGLRLFVVVSPGPDSPPGRVLHNLRFAQQYLEYMQDLEPGGVGGGIGAEAERLTVRVFLVDDGARVPATISFEQRYGTLAGLYDRNSITTVETDGKWSLGAEICQLENVDTPGFAAVLNENPSASGRVVVHGGGAGADHAYGAMRAVRKDLSGRLGVPLSRFRVVRGRSTGELNVELWID